jgi:tetratricopeptide (TPR) repeat protein
MKYLFVALLAILFYSCKNKPETKLPDSLQKQEMPASIQELFKKVSRNPDSAGLRFQLVDALDSLGAYQQALTQVDSLIRKDSLNYGLWYRKALVQENTKDTAGAIRSYKYAIRIYPSPDALLGVGNLLAEQKNDTALLISKQVASLRLGREYTAHCSFIDGVYYARKGEQQKAIEAFNNCIINDLNYMEAYMEKGFLYYDNRKMAEAMQVFQTVVTVKNTYADGYYWLAKCNEALNHKAEAITNYQQALTLDPKLAEAATALKRLGAN